MYTGVSAVPYTTQLKLGPEHRFLILACDGLWDVCSDQEAVQLAERYHCIRLISIYY